MLKTMFFKCHS